MCQLSRLDGRPQDRRAIELVADELGPLRDDDEEPRRVLVARDLGVAPQDRLGQHRRPLDLEVERRLVADVPHPVDLLELLDRSPGDERQVDRPLTTVEPLRQATPADRPILLAPVQPDREAEPVAGLGEDGEQLGPFGRPAQEIVTGDEPVRRRGQAAVALEAGPDEGLVGQVMAGEQPGDPLEERRLGQRAGRREEAEDGPLDPIGEWHGRRRHDPPCRRATSGPGSISTEATLVGPASARRG